MKKTLLLFFVFIFSYSFAQNIPALLEDFRNGTGKERVFACEKLAEYYNGESQDSLKLLGEDLFLYGIDNHYYPAIERGKITLAQYLLIIGKHADGIAMTKALLSNMEERGDDQMLGTACRLIALGYIYQKDQKSSYYWSLRAIRHDKRSDNPVTKVKSLQMLGETYILKHEYQKAIETYQRYVTVLKKHKEFQKVSMGYARLGAIYQLQEKYGIATRFFRYSMDYAKRSRYTTNPLSHAYNNLAIVYFEIGDTAQARAYFEKALDLRLKVKNFKAISESYYNLGDYYFYTSDNDKAIFWYTKSLDFSRKNNLKNETSDALTALAEVAKSVNDFKGSTIYMEQEHAIQNEIQLQNSEDDDELSRLKERIIRLEIEADVENGGLDSQEKGVAKLKWEWLVIGGLSIIVVFILLRRKKTA
ncbi:MAG: tetratricopeptide repeat protein [Bacteroidota bacterium]